MAAIKFLSPVDLNLNEIQNVRVHVLASDPATPSIGQIWYNSTNGKLRYYDGTNVITWYDASTTATASKLVLRDASGNIAANIGTFDSVTLNNAPSAGSDAASKSYVDSVAAGLYWKAPVRVASTGNVTISAPGASIDGVALTSGDRVLLKDQSTASENGIYVWNGAAVAMTRATDADTSTEVRAGMTCWVNEGATAQDTSWSLTTDDAITLGTTNLSFTQSGGISSITANAPISKNGNVFSLDYTARLTNNAGDLDLASGVVTPGSGTKVTADTYGRVTSVTEIVSSTGILTNTAAGTYTSRTITAGTGISVTDGNGVAGNPTIAISSIVARKFAATITGDNSTTQFTVTHSLNTRDVVASIRDSSHNAVMVDWQANGVNTILVSFAAAPAAAVEYHVTVVG